MNERSDVAVGKIAQVDSFDDDLFDLKVFADTLERFIAVEHNFVEGSLVIALDSPFGSGKSTFLRMWSNAIQDRGDSDDPIVVSMSAWEGDFIGDPLFAIVSAMVDQTPGDDSGSTKKKLLKAASSVAWFAIASAGQITRKYTGLDPTKAGEYAEKKTADDNFDQDGVDPFSAYRSRKAAMGDLRCAIREFVEDAGRPVYFLVDELDRCRPDYAVEFLETVKHIFDTENATFVLAIDREQLKNSVLTTFGRELDFDEYLRKFVHREVSLPAIPDTAYPRLASAYVPIYLRRAGIRGSFMNSNALSNTINLFSSLRITPRQAQEVFRTLGHVCALPEGRDNKVRISSWCVLTGTVFMATLRVVDVSLYKTLGSGDVKAADAAKLSFDLFGDSGFWWFALLVTGNGATLAKDEDLLAVAKDAGLEPDTFEPDWSGTGGISRIVERLESLGQFQ